MRRPGVWVANGIPTDPVKMLSWRPAALTSFFDYLSANRVFQYKAAHPETIVTVRFQHPYQWREDPSGWARWLGEMVASKWRDMRPLDPYVYFANEVNLHYENGDSNPANQLKYETREFYHSYAEWVTMTAERIKQQVPEMKLVTPPFAFGHHEDGMPDDDGVPIEGWAGYDYLADTVRHYFDNIITFHAYWGHAGGSMRPWLYDPVLSTWYAFRWRRVLKLFERRYNIQARLIIDEAGNFSPQDPDFTDQIIYHARGCLADRRVLALTYFLWEDPTNSPGNVPNSWWQRALNLNDHVARLAAMPEVPPGAEGPTIRLLLKDGKVQVIPVEEYLRAVVPAEIFATWPLESLKVQAVASRSYAMYAVEHPRHPNADLCTDAAHCQAYDPDRIHPNSDQAVRLTEGQIIIYQGQVCNALYSARCGGQTLDNEDAFGSAAPIPYLRSVPCINQGAVNGHRVGMCQWGAHDMAERGADYQTILTHYYTGVELSTGLPPEPGIIRGTTYDQANRALANVRLQLSRADWSAETASGPDGKYTFAGLSPATYSLQAVDYHVQRDGLVLQSGQELVVDLVLQVPEVGWTMEIQRGPGLPLIAGTLPRAGIEVTVEDPTGRAARLFSGSKPEYGAGGFETYAPFAGTYRILFLDQIFELPMNGQYTRVIFREGAAPPAAQGVIQGVLRDVAGVPQAGRQITLQGAGLSRTATTGADGSYRFAGLPAGAYTVRVAGTDVAHTVQSDGRTSVTLDLALPPSLPPAGQWQMEVTSGPGLPLLVGSLPEAGIAITIADPGGVTARVVSGSKPEYGVGGFETYAPRDGVYTIQFLDQTFSLQMSGQFTRVTFTRGVTAESQARLISGALPLSQAQALLQRFESDAQTRGLFSLEDI